MKGNNYLFAGRREWGGGREGGVVFLKTKFCQSPSPEKMEGNTTEEEGQL